MSDFSDAMPALRMLQCRMEQAIVFYFAGDDNVRLSRMTPVHAFYRTSPSFFFLFFFSHRPPCLALSPRWTLVPKSFKPIKTSQTPADGACSINVPLAVNLTPPHLATPHLTVYEGSPWTQDTQQEHTIPSGHPGQKEKVDGVPCLIAVF